MKETGMFVVLPGSVNFGLYMEEQKKLSYCVGGLDQSAIKMLYFRG